MLPEIAGMIEAVGLQIGAISRDFGWRRLGQNLLGDVLDRTVHDFVDEADVAVFTGRYARDQLASRDFGIDHPRP